jgi:hypothetical protein
MLGASAFCEYSVADQGILLAGISEMSALAINTLMLVLELCLVFLQWMIALRKHLQELL